MDGNLIYGIRRLAAGIRRQTTGRGYQAAGSNELKTVLKRANCKQQTARQTSGSRQQTRGNKQQREAPGTREQPPNNMHHATCSNQQRDAINLGRGVEAASSPGDSSNLTFLWKTLGETGATYKYTTIYLYTYIFTNTQMSIGAQTGY